MNDHYTWIKQIRLYYFIMDTIQRKIFFLIIIARNVTIILYLGIIILLILVLVLYDLLFTNYYLSILNIRIFTNLSVISNNDTNNDKKYLCLLIFSDTTLLKSEKDNYFLFFQFYLFEIKLI